MEQQGDWRSWERVIVGGIPVDCMNRSQLTDRLVDDWRARQAGADFAPRISTTVNGQVMSLFASHQGYRSALLAADYIAPDGMSVVTGSRMFTRRPLPERVATTDWFHDAADAAAAHGVKFYMLGATKEANAQAVERARALHPGLQIVGASDGYFKDSDLEALAKKIEASGADVLWIGVGNPRQALLAHRFKTLLPRLTWIRTCGGLFDHLSGAHKRAPVSLQNAGLEWAWRAALEPRAPRHALPDDQRARRLADGDALQHADPHRVIGAGVARRPCAACLSSASWAGRHTLRS